MIPGIIRIIDNKVKFEPDGLPKPEKCAILASEYPIAYSILKRKLQEEYEASKQLIEVVNVTFHIDKYYVVLNGFPKRIKNNQPCKAEVEGKTCTIIELTKI